MSENFFQPISFLMDGGRFNLVYCVKSRDLFHILVSSLVEEFLNAALPGLVGQPVHLDRLHASL